MATVSVVNTRTTPYIVDEDGHLLAGGERGQVDDAEPRVAWALENGVLVETGQPQPTSQPAPAAAAPIPPASTTSPAAPADTTAGESD